MVSNKIRKAQYAGKFYPDKAIELKQTIEGFFESLNAKNESAARDLGLKTLRAIISPHAGYVFSGEVAAAAFRAIPEKANYKRVFVLASSHSYSFNGASVYTSGNYSTPFGELEVDIQLSKKLAETSDVFTEHTESHLNEHSLEVQLPFLQHKLGNGFLLVPIILGTQNKETCKKIAETLRPWFTPENLFVISTDFSHYPEYSNANKVDLLTANAICSNDPEKLLLALRENKNLNLNNLATSLCGWTSVLTLLYLTEGSKLQYSKIFYRNSGDSKEYQNKNRVVGYWAMAVYDNTSLQINDEEKEELLDKARTSIHNFVKKGERGKTVKPFTKGILNDKMGVFVSVYVGNKLRGCIGGFAQDKTLNELVQQMAVSALCDRRFDTIGPEELDQMELEISVLSPLKEIKSKDEIIPGIHGIYIKTEWNSGTFLPQVATIMGWDVDEFLGRCSRDKAGIGWDGWKNAQVFTYEAVVFRGV